MHAYSNKAFPNSAAFKRDHELMGHQQDGKVARLDKSTLNLSGEACHTYFQVLLGFAKNPCRTCSVIGAYSLQAARAFRQPVPIIGQRACSCVLSPWRGLYKPEHWDQKSVWS